MSITYLHFTCSGCFDLGLAVVESAQCSSECFLMEYDTLLQG